MSERALAGISVQRAESPGLWVLAWRRFRHDRVGVVALAVAVFFFILMLAAALHLVAGDWAQEVGVNYAPPTFVGPDSTEAPAIAPPPADSARSERAADSGIVDPLAGVLAAIKRDP